MFDFSMRPRYLPLHPTRPVRPFNRRRWMTISAGFCFQGGILLCADTEITVGQLKTNNTKILRRAFPDCSIAIAIAGDVAQATSVVQQIFADLEKTTRPRDLQAVEALIRVRIEDVYERLLLRHPRANYQEGPFFDLVIGLHTASDGLCLLASSESAVTREDTYVCRGVGMMLAGYIADPLYHADMTLGEIRAIAAYMMSHVKDSVSGCGGRSQFLILDEKAIRDQMPYDIKEFEAFAKLIDESLPMLFWVAGDPSATDDDVEGVLNTLRDDILARRKTARAASAEREKRKRHKGVLFRSSKDGVS